MKLHYVITQRLWGRHESEVVTKVRSSTKVYEVVMKVYEVVMKVYEVVNESEVVMKVSIVFSG